MKIAYVITRLDSVGGAQIHVRDLSQRLVKEGNQVSVVGGSGTAYAEQLRSAGVTVFQIPYLNRAINPQADIRATGALRACLSTFRPDIISSHSSKAGFLGRIVGASLGIPTIFTAHGWAFTEGVTARAALAYRWSERTVAPLARRIITVSEYDRSLALAHRVASPKKVTTVHNGMPDIATPLRAKPGTDPVRLIMVARFQSPKDHETLLQALARAKSLRWILDLIGDGPLETLVKRRVEELGLAQRVRFLGHRDDVAQHLAQAQLFLLTTRWEGFPRSILEAMRAGLPVIATNVGGCSESVTDGETGFLVPREDVDALNARLVSLIEKPSLRRKMGLAGRQRFEDHFTFERMLRRTVSIYEEVLSAKSTLRGGLQSSSLSGHD